MKSFCRIIVHLALLVHSVTAVPHSAFGHRQSLACFASKGFGSSATKKEVRGTTLSNKAKKLLKKHKNDVDAASSDYFRSQVEQLGDVADLSSDKIHEARVAATWNTVAMFLPQDYKRTKGKVEPYVDRRLRHIMAACRGSSGKALNILDVGCGDGAIVPYLEDSDTYSGVDVSTEMIDLGKQLWPKHSLWVGSFPKDVPQSTMYNTILFNGSLQFFRDTRQVLADAEAFLKPGGRIVLSHVNGAKFVRDECRSNPSVAVRNMPNGVSFQSMGDCLGLKVLGKDELLQESDGYDQDLDGDDDQFYLVALEKPE